MLTDDKHNQEDNKHILNYLERDKRGRLNSLLLILVVLVSTLGIIVLLDYQLNLFQFSQPPVASSSETGEWAKSSVPKDECGSSPFINGETYTFNNFPDASRQEISKLVIANEHSYPLVVRFNSPYQNIPYQAVSLLPRTETSIKFPVGTYGLVVMAGTRWCNVDQGFADGMKITSKNLIGIHAGVTNKLTFSSRGPGAGDVSLFSSRVSPLPIRLAPVEMVRPEPRPRSYQPPPVQVRTISKSELAQYEEVVAENDSGPDNLSHEERCFKTYAQVRDNINARMRMGYSSQLGEWYRERLRENEHFYSECKSQAS